MEVLKMTLSQVKLHLNSKGTWHGYLIPCKMYFNPMYACEVQLLHTNNDQIAVISPNGNVETFDNFYNSWAYYNTNHEQGYYAHYYMIVA